MHKLGFKDYPEPVVAAGPKKIRKTITLEIQKSVWDTHIGTGIKEAPCPLCGHTTIRSPSSRCGLECAHIIAENFFVGELTPLSLYPSCASCNSSCRTNCLLDFLFRAGRYEQLKRLFVSVHRLYCILNPNLSPERLLMHNVIDSLYGFERYKAGGGLYNDLEIFNFAKSVHLQQLNREMQDLTRQMEEKAGELRLLSTSIPERKRPPSII